MANTLKNQLSIFGLNQTDLSIVYSLFCNYYDEDNKKNNEKFV